jgi:O-antigen/teichoic acid export membrane protein
VDDVQTNAELTQATAAGLRWVTYARLATEILLLGSMVVLARLIPPAAFGVFAVIVIVQELALTVPSEGVGGALVQRKTVDRAHLQGGMVLSLLAGAALGAATLLLSVLVVGPLFGHQTAVLVALASPWFLLGSLFAVPSAILRRRLDFRRLSLLDFTQTAVRSVVSLVLAAGFGLDAAALVLGGLAGMTAALVLAIAFAPPPFPRWRAQAMRDLLSYGGPASLACLAWTGFRNGDYAIIGARLGTAQAGFYWRGYQLAVEYQRKISVVMTQIAFPVLSRTAGADELFALRRRMVQLLTVVLFPLLATLVLVAPVAVPWLFGPAWEPAVLPTQILAGAGAATIVIDSVGSALMAEGRARALLGYGVAHFVVYAGAVLVASGRGLTAVAVTAVVVHGAFLIVAYVVLLHGRADRALRFLWGDVAPACVACVALLAVAGPTEWALRGSGVPAFPHLALTTTAAAAGYLLALRAWFPASFGDLTTLVRRLLPARRPLPIARPHAEAQATP